MDTKEKINKPIIYLWLSYAFSIGLTVFYLTKIFVFSYFHYGLRHNYYLEHFMYHLPFYLGFVLLLLILLFIWLYIRFDISNITSKSPSTSLFLLFIIFSISAEPIISSLHESDLEFLLNDIALQEYLSNLDFNRIFHYMSLYLNILNWSIYIFIFLYLIYKLNKSKNN